MCRDLFLTFFLAYRVWWHVDIHIIESLSLHFPSLEIGSSWQKICPHQPELSAPHRILDLPIHFLSPGPRLKGPSLSSVPLPPLNRLSGPAKESCSHPLFLEGMPSGSLCCSSTSCQLRASGLLWVTYYLRVWLWAKSLKPWASQGTLSKAPNDVLRPRGGAVFHMLRRTTLHDSVQPAPGSHDCRN